MGVALWCLLFPCLVWTSRGLLVGDPSLQAPREGSYDYESYSPSYFGSWKVSISPIFEAAEKLIFRSYTNPIAWQNLPHHYDLTLIYTVS